MRNLKKPRDLARTLRIMNHAQDMRAKSSTENTPNPSCFQRGRLKNRAHPPPQPLLAKLTGKIASSYYSIRKVSLWAQPRARLGGKRSQKQCLIPGTTNPAEGQSLMLSWFLRPVFVHGRNRSLLTVGGVGYSLY